MIHTRLGDTRSKSAAKPPQYAHNDLPSTAKIIWLIGALNAALHMYMHVHDERYSAWSVHHGID